MSDKKDTPEKTIGDFLDKFDESNLPFNEDDLKILKSLPIEREVFTWDKI